MLQRPISRLIKKFVNHLHLKQGSKLNLPGGRWRQSLGEAGSHEVFRKRGSDRNIPMLSNTFIFIQRRGPKIIILRAAVGPRAASLRPLTYSVSSALCRSFTLRTCCYCWVDIERARERRARGCLEPGPFAR